MTKNLHCLSIAFYPFNDLRQGKLIISLYIWFKEHKLRVTFEAGVGRGWEIGEFAETLYETDKYYYEFFELDGFTAVEIEN